MEKNLPFVSLPIADKGYNKLVIPFLGKLDDGNVFKNIIVLLFSVLAIVLLIVGIYLSITGLFGEDGFVKNYISALGLEKSKIAGSVVGLIFGLLLSLLTVWTLFSILKRRADQMKDIEYEGLSNFVFIKIIPKVILLTGEMLFILFMYTGILQIVAALVGSFVYAPLSGYPGLLLGIFPGMDMFEDIVPQQIYGGYENFTEYTVVGLMSIVGAFIVLIAFYIYREIYNYILKLVTNLIAFLPKFAIPLAIRKRDEKH